MFRLDKLMVTLNRFSWTSGKGFQNEEENAILILLVECSEMQKKNHPKTQWVCCRAYDYHFKLSLGFLLGKAILTSCFWQSFAAGLFCPVIKYMYV